MSIRVKPHPRLDEIHGAGAYVKGVPAAGAILPDDEAKRLLDAGLVVRVNPPKAAKADRKE